MQKIEYAFKSTKLSRYASTMIVDPREKMSKFVSIVSEIVVKECRMAMLIKEMDIFCLTVHA